MIGGQFLKRRAPTDIAAIETLLQHSATLERRNRGYQINDAAGRLILCEPYEGGGYIVEEIKGWDGSRAIVIAYDVDSRSNPHAAAILQGMVGHSQQGSRHSGARARTTASSHDAAFVPVRLCPPPLPSPGRYRRCSSYGRTRRCGPVNTSAPETSAYPWPA